MTQSPNINTELNACGILDSFNIPNVATIKAAGDIQTQSPSKQGIQVEVIQSLICVEFVRPIQNPIQIDTYIILVGK